MIFLITNLIPVTVIERSFEGSPKLHAEEWILNIKSVVRFQVVSDGSKEMIVETSAGRITIDHESAERLIKALKNDNLYPIGE